MRSFIAKSYSSKINNNEHTMTSVSIAFRWAMLCTKSELRFRQYSFNHRIRNLRSVEVLRLTPYPLYQHAIVPFEFPLQVGWLFPLFTFNNVPLRGRYTFALSSALFSAYYLPKDQRYRNELPLLALTALQPYLSENQKAAQPLFQILHPAQASEADPMSLYPPLP